MLNYICVTCGTATAREDREVVIRADTGYESLQCQCIHSNNAGVSRFYEPCRMSRHRVRPSVIAPEMWNENRQRQAILRDLPFVDSHMIALRGRPSGIGWAAHVVEQAVSP
jgi:hypothetical protein